jgi:hypothetical protein
MRTRIGPTRKLPLALAALAAGAAAALAAQSSAVAADAGPEALIRARAIGAEVDARYRLAPGRKLAVTEVTTTGVVGSLTLVAEPFDQPRVVSAGNGIYFALCPPRATCPYPARSRSWPATAFRPRRQALELALRTFLETSATLVVVSLPTVEPTWVVFERDDLLATFDAPVVPALFGGAPAVADAQLRELVDRLTRSRLFVPIAVLPPLRDTIVAVSLSV